MKITLPINWREGWAEVEAELLPDIAPHLAHVATFAINRGAHQDAYWWIVTNIETGLKVSYSPRKATALKLARRILALKTPQAIHASYRTRIKMYPQIVGTI